MEKAFSVQRSAFNRQSGKRRTVNDERQTASDVQISDVERVVFDESAARFDHVAHQNSKHLVGLPGVVLIQIDSKEFAVERIHRGGEQFFCVHLAEPLEPFDLNSPAANFLDRIENLWNRE